MMLCMVALLTSCNEELKWEQEKDSNGNLSGDKNYVFAYKTISNTETRAAGLKTKYWPNNSTIRIKFLNGSEVAKQRVQHIASEWLNHANLNFEYVSGQVNADVKIAFQWNGDQVSWSMIGTDCKSVPQNQPSMNLMLFNDTNVSEINSEDFSAIILREFGHMLGLIYEYQSPESRLQWDRQRVKTYFLSQKWTPAQVEDIFKIYSRSETNYTNFDEESIMLLYFPGYLTTDGRGTRWNTSLSAMDKQFMRTIYPGQVVLPERISLEYKQDNDPSSYSYTGVRIGEYYWVNNNFYHRVPRNWNNLEGWENDYPMTQARLDKYLPCARLQVSQYQVNMDDFKKYYGIYYNRQSVNYMSNRGRMYEAGSPVPGNWDLPSAADYQQLFAMCPFVYRQHTDLNEIDVRFALSAHAGSNPLTFNINDPTGGPYKTYWFMNGEDINIYDFNMMPGGACLNGPGPWYNGVDDPHMGEIGDIYHLFYTVGYYTKESHVYLHDYLDTRNSFSYHWFNVRWCRQLTDAELGYKLYINNAKTDIKKLALTDPAPAGYTELPKGYLRGFYVQYILDNPSPVYTVADIVRFANTVNDRTL